MGPSCREQRRKVNSQGQKAEQKLAKAKKIKPESGEIFVGERATVLPLPNVLSDPVTH